MITHFTAGLEGTVNMIFQGHIFKGNTFTDCFMNKILVNTKFHTKDLRILIPLMALRGRHISTNHRLPLATI